MPACSCHRRGAASVGNPSDGDPANGIEATALGAYAMFQIFTELGERLIAAGNLTPDVDTLTQLRDAIQAIVDASANLDTVAGDARYLRRGQNLGDVNNVGSSRGNLNAAPINNPTFTGNPRSHRRRRPVTATRALRRPRSLAMRSRQSSRRGLI